MRLINFLIAIFSLSVTVAQDNRPFNILGKWKAIVDSSTAKAEVLLVFDSAALELQLGSSSRRVEYTLSWVEDTCTITLIGGSSPVKAFVVVPVNHDAFDFNTIENNKYLAETKNLKPGSIVWGWNDPRPIRFVRQKTWPSEIQSARARLKISSLTRNFFIYTTFNTYQGNQMPAHGMFLDTEDGVVLFDTPWDTTQFQPLLDSIRSRTGKPVKVCIATHWHGDRTAGLAYYRTRGVKTYTTVLTDELSRQNGQKRAEFLLYQDSLFRVGSYTFETYYPGPGHTKDNIIIWFPREQILYGGCLIKGAEAENLGYLGDADVSAYESTLIRVREKCPRPNYIIVSHHDWHSLQSLEHSIKLAGALEKK